MNRKTTITAALTANITLTAKVAAIVPTIAMLLTTSVTIALFTEMTTTKMRRKVSHRCPVPSNHSLTSMVVAVGQVCSLSSRLLHPLLPVVH